MVLCSTFVVVSFVVHQHHTRNDEGRLKQLAGSIWPKRKMYRGRQNAQSSPLSFHSSHRRGDARGVVVVDDRIVPWPPPRRGVFDPDRPPDRTFDGGFACRSDKITGDGGL
jgi:hypothetical protein